MIDYDCVNSVCKVSGRGGVKNRGKVQTATNWAVSFYGAEVAPNKKRKVSRIIFSLDFSTLKRTAYMHWIDCIMLAA